MNEREKDTAFLKECILHDDSPERHDLEERITQLQHNERCVWRAVGLMGWLVGLALAGICYAVWSLADYPQSVAHFMTQFISKVFCALGLGSLICLLAFLGLGSVYRKELDQHREECRRVARKLLEARRGGVTAKALPNVVNRSDAVGPTASSVIPPREMSH